MPTPEELAAEAQLMVTARERLAPLLDLVRQSVPSGCDAAIVVTFEALGVRAPIVISTNRHRIAEDLASWVASVRAERKHDRGRG